MRREAKNQFRLRRRLLTGLAAAIAQPVVLAQAFGDGSHLPPPASRLPQFAPVVPGYVMRFPHDEGSHPDFRLEWWYITGWLNDTAARPLGFQITFFRARPDLIHDNPSAFTPRHIMIAHAAVSDPAHGRLIHVQRAARAGFALAGADEGRMRAWIDDWSLDRRDGAFRAQLPAQEFQLDLAFEPTQPPLLQGENGLSPKGPAPESASYYYSLPHLKVTGTLARNGKSQTVGGSAWLDHEWSSSYMAKEAVGWDWIGVNLDDGSALMAFRMRDKNSGSFWAGGAYRRPDGNVKIFSSDEVRFTPRRGWRSPRTGTNYPVSWAVKAGALEVVIEPLMDDQEHDTRASAGTIYWEGAVRVLHNGKPIGRGYLELTGYGRPLRL